VLVLRSLENYRGSAWPSDWDEVLLRHPESGVSIGLLQHASNLGETFSEFGTGLDHVEFEVTSFAELDAWRDQLDKFGVAHSGAWPHIVSFRDPDNIQLEFFCPPSQPLVRE
jgi:catechol 2,3-dioxygenase-like lactoylglutathione lyase family enzyme